MSWPVAGRPVADDLGVDGRPARLRHLELLDHHHAAATGDDEAVAVRIVGARGLLGSVVVLRGQRAHRVEQARQRPMLLLAAAGEHTVLLAELDQLESVADAVCAGRAGRGDRVVDALDAERRGQARRDGAGHGLGDAVGADAANALRAQDVGRLDLAEGGAAAGAGDDAGALVGHLAFLEPGVRDGVAHREVGVGGRLAHEAQLLSIDRFLQIDRGGGGDVAAHAHLRVLGAARRCPSAPCAGTR